MKNKKVIILSVLIVVGLVFGFVTTSFVEQTIAMTKPQVDSIGVKQVASQIVSNGSVTAQDTATLHFQTGGKVVYLPFKEGDKITQGQTIAQLDTYELQQELTQALNNYRSTRDTFDQTQETNQVGALSNEQSTTLHTAGAGIGGDTNYTVVNDTVKRIVDQNQANLDNSVINVELANYAKQLATLSSPLTGIVTHEDVTVPNQNVTTITGFTVIDPKTLVFSAQVSENDIDYVQIGAPATIQLNGLNRPLTGSVSKIYPDKEVLANGESVYQVDISVDSLPTIGKLNQTGIATITSSTDSSVMLVPTWTILSHQSIWVVENGKQVLKYVTLGKIHGNMIEVTSGLSSEDSVIVNPASIATRFYQML